MRKTPRAQLVAYGVAVVAPAVSLVMRLLVGPQVMEERALYITFCPAVMITAYLGGFGPGMAGPLPGWQANGRAADWTDRAAGAKMTTVSPPFPPCARASRLWPTCC